VAIVPNFATDQECEELMKAGGSDEDMGRAHEDEGPSSYRRSYSSNIDVDYENRTNMITRFAERMFAFVRGVTGYEVYGPGQEPINAVLYKNAGDEYRPHCDGNCDGEQYPFGARLATSILYCDIPEIDGQPAGGQTSFTRSGLMVAPRKGDLLLFAYKYTNDTMDNGLTEHSGCKILGGRKWIATQWYREGVDYEHPWQEFDF
jgi:prolyl 4-hydroxylase